MTALHCLWYKTVTSSFSLEEGVLAEVASCPHSFSCGASPLKEKEQGA